MGKLDQKGSLLGSDAGFALGVGCELAHDGKLLPKHGLAVPRRPSGVARLRLASWRACAWPQLASLLV